MSMLYGCARAKTILGLTHVENFKDVGIAYDWQFGGVA